MTVHLQSRAWCVQCEWTTEGPDADLQAVKHLKSTGHAVGTKSTPISNHTDQRTGTGAGEEGDPDSSEATAWVTRSTDCPEAPAQARLLASTSNHTEED